MVDRAVCRKQRDHGRHGRATQRARRGSMYAAILIIATMVAVIGMSGLSISRIRFRANEDAGNVAAARLYAQSAVERGALKITNDPAWRTNYTHDVWDGGQALASGSIFFKLVDEQYGDLAFDPDNSVRLFGKGVAGDAVRIYSVLLDPLGSAAGSILSNGDMEDGLTDWVTMARCDIESHVDEPHGGLAYIWVKNRDSQQAGPIQDLSTSLQNGTVYTAEAWVKSKDFPELFRITLWYGTAEGMNTSVSTGWQLVGTSWEQISGTLTPSWSGTLNMAMWTVETLANNNEFKIDDASMTEDAGDRIFSIHPGSWRQEIEP